ncbi:uncharacterized protein LOC117291006 isoform X2 [Asterias rubens]|nr:uncharacterized protein LOC117291006 isoform X2 [Asterias rubens]XP_033628495.1 uncharacterized protein LOC117291006 isoform X2 [Asterias rubens]
MEIYNEYDAPKKMQYAFCQQISSAEFEQQGAVETEKALQELMSYLEKNPAVYKKVLVRKKQEEAENAGIFSYMKCKVMATMRGPDYLEDEVTNEETMNKLGALEHEMGKVYDYAQEANKSKKRFSRRIAAKKSKAAKGNKSTPPANFKVPSSISHSTKKKAVPTPPPYPPPTSASYSMTPESDDDVFLYLPITPARRPPLHPDASINCTIPVPPPPPPPTPSSTESRVLKERTNLKHQGCFDSPKYVSTPKPPLTPGFKASLERYGSTSSLSSIASVHDELVSFNKSKLKSVSKPSPRKSANGTPFKTPQSRKRVISASIVRGSITDICGVSTIDAFNQQMLEKFRNARSPIVNSPASGINSPSGFTP